MRHERRARRAAEAGQDIEDALGQADIIGDPAEFNRRKRGQFGGFEDDCRPGRQRRRNLPCCHQQRIIPGNNLRSNTDRFMPEYGFEAIIGQGQRLILTLIQCLGEIGIHRKTAGDVVDIPQSLRQRLAVVRDFQAGKFLFALDNPRGHGAQVDGTGSARRLAPAAGKRLTGCLDGLIDIGCGRSRSFANDLLGRGVHDRKEAALRGLCPGAIDEEKMAARRRYRGGMDVAFRRSHEVVS